MEINKLFVDCLIYVMLLYTFNAFILEYIREENKIMRVGAIVCACAVIILSWIYTYATIGMDVAKVISGAH